MRARVTMMGLIGLVSSAEAAGGQRMASSRAASPPPVLAPARAAVATPRLEPPSQSPTGAQVVTGWMGSVLLGFAAWRVFDEPAGRHSRVRDDWGYTPRANLALGIGSFVGGTLGVWLKGRANGSGGTLLGTSLGAAIPTVPVFLMHDDPLLPLVTVIAWAPLQGAIGYMGYRLSAPDVAGDIAPLAEEEAPAAPRRSGDVLTGEDLATSSATNVYDAIRQLRSQWLATARMRSPTGQEGGGETAQLIAYVDGVAYGAIEALRDLPLTGIAEVRYFDARAATNRFGTGHGAGAIVVTLTRP